MSVENLQTKCKQCLKCIENFLRRIALNLGNTPSQTEVKIISCIPIDVTDLQQKIVNLEKQLDEAKKTRKDTLHISQANRSKPTFSTSSESINSQIEYMMKQCDCLPEISPKNTISAACTALSIINRQQECLYKSTNNPNLFDCNDNKDFKKDNKRNIFKKTKEREPKNKHNSKSQFACYAQTMSSPFKNYNNIEFKSTKCNYKAEQSYFADIMQKQFQPRPLFTEYSDTSQLSPPVCRDNEQNICPTYPSKSDICSCCCGQFQNLDNLNKGKKIHVTSSHMEITKSDYYDSSLYDIIPVKEKSTIEMEIPKIKQGKNDLNNIDYRAGGCTTDTFRPFVINFQTSPETKFNYPKKLSVTLPIRKDKKKRAIPKRNRVITTPVNQQTDITISNSGFVDCGNVYVKQIKNCKITKKHKSMKMLLTRKNAECLTVNFNDRECQTTTTQSVQIDSGSQEDKTEETLNQIKIILQSVLTEVKTNKLKKFSENISKKNAVIQKGTSQGIVGHRSSLEHSFVYSPHNINPFVASCSCQKNSNHFRYSGQPYFSYKCMHNVPVLIHTPGPHTSTMCYRNTSHVHKPINKHAATTYSDTENVKEERSKDTEKLIKDIYKSIAINIDVPTKDTSIKEFNELLSTEFNSDSKTDYKHNKIDAITDQAVKTVPSAILEKDTQTDLSFNLIASNTFNKKLGSNTLPVQSQLTNSTKINHNLRNNNIKNFLNKNTRSVESVIKEILELDKDSNTTIVINEHSEISSNGSDNNSEKPIKKKVRKNILSKMFRSVKLFKNKGKEINSIQNVDDDEVSHASDPDDYETIYKHKINTTKPISSQVRVHHSKISCCRQLMNSNRERFRAQPYIKQECRKQSNDELTFQEHQRECFAEGYTYNEHPMFSHNYKIGNAVIGRKVPLFEHGVHFKEIVNANMRSISPKEHAFASKGFSLKIIAKKKQ